MSFLYYRQNTVRCKARTKNDWFNMILENKFTWSEQNLFVNTAVCLHIYCLINYYPANIDIITIQHLRKYVCFTAMLHG